MVRKLTLALLFFCLAVNSGCYLAAYPIDDPPTTKLDERYLGKWYAESKKKKTDNIWMNVLKRDDYGYAIVFKEKKEIDTFNAFLSVINGATFFNIYKDGEPRYVFCRILDAKPEMLTVAMVSDTNMANLSSSAAVRARLLKNLNNPTYYGDTSFLSRSKR